MNRYVFWGPKIEFIKNYKLNSFFEFSKLVQIAQKEDKQFEIKGYKHSSDDEISAIENLVIFSDEYAMVNEWVLDNFEGFLNRFEIENIYFQNPPNNVFEKIKKTDNYEENRYEYLKINTECIKEMNNSYSDVIIGQEKAKEELLKMLYSATFDFLNEKPLVLMFYGTSGVGKTETAKFISSKMGGNLFRKQFSMFQNNEFANYLFGAKHSEASFARDLLDRETNVILLDEFDKANKLFFSAFYQLFDEGVFVDKNYSVELKNAIIICTSNFESIEEIKSNLGYAIVNRFDGFIHFNKFNESDCKKIIVHYYKKYSKFLNPSQNSLIKGNNIEQILLNNAYKFSNAREIDRIVREVIVSTLYDKEIKN